jgi:spermidine synthase
MYRVMTYMQQGTVLTFEEILLQTKERAQHIAIYEVGTTSSLVEMNPLQTKNKTHDLYMIQQLGQEFL